LKNKKPWLEILKSKVRGSLWNAAIDSRPTDISGNMCYYSCSLLPLNLFIQCIPDDDISALIISGHPPDDQLHEAAAGIYSEYLELNKMNEQWYILLLKRDIGGLNFTITAVGHSLYFMSFEPQKALADVIIGQGFKYTYSSEIIQTNIAEVDVIQQCLSEMKKEVQEKQKELDDYIECRKRDTFPISYFNNMLIRLSDNQGYSIRAKNITVIEFLKMVNNYLEEKKVKKGGK
jgi:hypothetical protein